MRPTASKQVEPKVSSDSCEPLSALTGICGPGSKHLDDFIERRDARAFAEIVRIYGPMVYGVCRRVVGSHHDAEDAFQATFLILSQKAASIKNRRVLTSWLYQVAYQVSLRSKAAARRRRAKEQPMDEVREPASAESSVWGDLETILDSELNRLSEKYRVPILLCDLGGSTLKDAAMELGGPQGTLSTRLTKARSMLAQRLAKHGFELSAGALAVLISQNAVSAAVPTSLVASTLQTAGVMSVGQAMSAGVVSSKAAALAQGTMKAMLLVNLKFVAAAVVLLATAVLGLQQQPDEQKAQVNLPPVRAEVNNAQPFDEVELPPDVRQALEENAAQLNPIAISYTSQRKSRLSDQETFERLNLSKSPNAQSLFNTWPQRLIWQDQKHYLWSKQTIEGRGGSSKDIRQNERSYDGSIVYSGHLHERQRDRDQLFLVRNSNLNLKGQDAASALCANHYFQGFAGLSFPPWETARVADMRAESFVLSSIQRGGKLVSVEYVRLDERPHVKVDVIVENPEKLRAEKTDLEELKNPNTTSVQIILTPEERAQQVQNVMLARQLPATKRRVFYLDPEWHYAVRRTEEWYEPGTLLLRCDCSDFEQIPERQLWLPRKYETQYYSYTTVPGVVFDEPFLSEVTLVTELNGDRVPDDQFVLNYTRPGVMVIDESAPSTTGQPGGTAQTSLNYTTGHTPEETLQNKNAATKIHFDPSTGTAQATIPMEGSRKNGSSSSFWPRSTFHGVVLANGVVVILIGAFLAYRRFFK